MRTNLKLSTRSIVAILTVFIGLVPCYGMDKVIKSGPWEFAFNKSNGYWKYLKWNETLISENKNNLPPFNWGPGWPGGKINKKLMPSQIARRQYLIPDWKIYQKGSRYVLKSSNWNGAEKILELTYGIGEWVVKESLKFGDEVNPDILTRILSMTYSPNGATDKPALLAFVILNNPLPNSSIKGSYLFPANHQETSYRPRKMSWLKGKMDASFPLLFEFNSKNTALYFSDCRDDRADIQVCNNGNNKNIQNDFVSYGWAFPGRPQVIGPAYIQMQKKNLENTLAGGIWKLYDRIGLKTPVDRPDWIKDAVLFSYSPGGSSRSGWNDLGGFVPAREEMIPRLARLGINTMWMLPVMEGHSAYHPKDYFKLNKKFGTTEEYHALVEAAHNNGMRVIQDVVPHGTSATYGALRGNKPWDMSFDKNGNPLAYMPFDYLSPSWQKYMKDVAQFYSKKYKIDGFRIDLADGTHKPNWRRADFPSINTVPESVPAEWWKKELAANDGKMPPLAYARASMGRRRGGLEMSKAVRSGSKAVNPDTGMVMGEVEFIPYMQANDIIYDMVICYYFLRGKFRVPPVFKRPDGEFADVLSHWLEQQKYGAPKDTIRMRYAESHDSFPTREYLGVGAARACVAMTFLIDGVPMIYDGSDNYIGVFLQKLIAIRKDLPEFRRGDAFYTAVKSSSKNIFACLRKLENKVSIGVINMSPEQVKTTLSLPRELLPPGPFNVWNCWNGNKISPDNKKLKLDLAPWGVTVIALRPENKPCPVMFSQSSPVNYESTVNEITASINRWGTVEVKAPGYTLSVKSSGELHYFADSQGNKVIDDCKLISESFLGQGSIFVESTKKKAGYEKTDYGYKINGSTVLSSGAEIGFEYKCHKNYVEFGVSLSNAVNIRNIGLALKGNDIDRWQVNSAEGLIDDFFYVKGKYGKPTSRNRKSYRPCATPIVWQNETIPVDLSKPVITALQKNGTGVAVGIVDPLKAGLDNIMVLNRFKKESGWYLAFLWHEEKPLYNLPDDENMKKFAVTLKSQAKALKPPAKKASYNVGRLAVRNKSYGWEISNPYYSLELPRSGGYIYSLKDSAGHIILDESYLYIKKGLYAQSNDLESGVKLWEENGCLKMLFAGMFKNGSQSGSKVISPDRTRFFVQYTFDGESPVFKVKSGIFYEGVKPVQKLGCGYLAKLASTDYIILGKDGQSIGVLGFDSKSLKVVSCDVMPDYVKVSDSKNTPLFTLNNFSGNGSSFVKSVFIRNNRLNWGEPDNSDFIVEPGKWYESSFSVNIKKSDELSSDPESWWYWTEKKMESSGYSHSIEDGRLVFNIPKLKGSKNWHVQIGQNVGLKAGVRYRLSFELQSPSNGNIAVTYSRINKPWKDLGLKSIIKIYKGERSYSVDFTALENGMDIPGAIKFRLASLPGRLSIRDIKLEKIR